MSLRDKLIRDLPKRKSPVRIAQVAKAYTVSEAQAGNILAQLTEEGRLSLEVIANIYYYRWIHK